MLLWVVGAGVLLVGASHFNLRFPVLLLMFGQRFTILSKVECV